MTRDPVLLIDALINLLLGVLLLLFRPGLVEFLGIPQAEQTFYPTILGAVLIGIGLALVLECSGRPKGLVGLGLGGAVAINLCGGVVLAVWLASGRLTMPMRGQAVLWSLVVILVAISVTELYVHQRRVPASRE
jgi:peptidoglycan/LPS O-acetylase OafA/YrhL